MPTSDSAGVSVGLNLDPLVGNLIGQEMLQRKASEKRAAEAERELARVRSDDQERYGAWLLDCGKLVPSEIKEVRLRDHGRIKRNWPVAIDPLAKDSDRSGEAVRRLLPKFVKLLRYEHRAAGRRNRAIRKLCGNPNNAI